MKVRIQYTVCVSDKYRSAINLYYGQKGMATRKQVQKFLKQNGGTLDNDIMFDYNLKSIQENPQHKVS